MVVPCTHDLHVHFTCVSFSLPCMRPLQNVALCGKNPPTYHACMGGLKNAALCGRLFALENKCKCVWAVASYTV